MKRESGERLTERAVDPGIKKLHQADYYDQWRKHIAARLLGDESVPTPFPSPKTQYEEEP